jgi:hypothetical protein
VIVQALVAMFFFLHSTDFPPCLLWTHSAKLARKEDQEQLLMIQEEEKRERAKKKKKQPAQP